MSWQDPKTKWERWRAALPDPRQFHFDFINQRHLVDQERLETTKNADEDEQSDSATFLKYERSFTLQKTSRQ